MADRLLGEAVRLDRHPLIRFRPGAAGLRRPFVVGTRLYVHQVIATLRGHDGDVDATASYFDVEPQKVRAALEYYGDFPDEVDADAEEAVRVADAEQARWEQRQRALG